MTELSGAVCSITRTQRRRYFWVAYWSGEPTYTPFRMPDASGGGEKTPEAALRAAEKAAGRHLQLIESHWAKAFMGTLRGKKPEPPREKTAAPERPASNVDSQNPWEVLGLPPGSSLAQVRAAYRSQVLRVHPDQGGEADAFRAVHAAYERLVRRLARKRR